MCSHLSDGLFLHYDVSSADHSKYVLLFADGSRDQVQDISVAEIIVGAGD
jgi:hypothetical protein